MPNTRSQLVSSVRTLCSEPADAPLDVGGLPTSLIFEELTSIESMMIRDLNLSPRNARVAKVETTLYQDQEEFLIPESDFRTPAFAYLLNNTTSDYWYPVEIVDQPSLAQATVNGTLAISVTSGAIRFSWFPDSTQTLRLWYERTGNDAPTMDGQTELGNLYDEYLKLQTAAQCREHLKMEVGSVLAARLAKSESQWNRDVKRGFQRGLASKNPSLPLRRFRGTFLDRRTHFVP